MDLVLSLLVLAAVALVAGAIVQWRRGKTGKQTGLLLVLAAVMIVNVLIWTIPNKDGTVPMDRAAEGVR